MTVCPNWQSSATPGDTPVASGPRAICTAIGINVTAAAQSGTGINLASCGNATQVLPGSLMVRLLLLDTLRQAVTGEWKANWCWKC